MDIERAMHICKRMAQQAIPEKITGYAVWYDDDYNTYRVSDYERVEELIDRCFITRADIVYQYDA